MSTVKSAVSIHCPECGSDNVRKDALVKWNVEAQAWEVCEDISGSLVCGDCGAEPARFNEVATNNASRVLFNGVVKDWNADELAEEYHAKYRLTIEQSLENGHVSFQLCCVEQHTNGMTEEPQGLAGVIEVRNGFPAMTLGIDPYNHGMYIESDVVNGLHVHADAGIRREQSSYKPYWLEKPFTTQFYSLASNPEWLMECSGLIAPDT